MFQIKTEKNISLEDVELLYKQLNYQIKLETGVKVILLQKELKMWMNLEQGKFYDCKNIAKDISCKSLWDISDYEIKISDDSSMNDVLKLFSQESI